MFNVEKEKIREKFVECVEKMLQGTRGSEYELPTALARALRNEVFRDTEDTIEEMVKNLANEFEEELGTPMHGYNKTLLTEQLRAGIPYEVVRERARQAIELVKSMR